MVFFVLGFAAGWLTLMAIFKFVEYKVDRELMKRDPELDKKPLPPEAKRIRL